MVLITKEYFGKLFAALQPEPDISFGRWLFEAGMGYGELVFWWPAAKEKRPAPHEGIDFFCYEDRAGRHHYLADQMVPAPCDSRVVAVCPDFLGHSIFLQPEPGPGNDGLYIIGHTVPRVTLLQQVRQGDAIATVAVPEGRVPGHLHVSYLQGNRGDLPAQLNWPALLAGQQHRFRFPFATETGHG